MATISPGLTSRLKFRMSGLSATYWKSTSWKLTWPVMSCSSLSDTSLTSPGSSRTWKIRSKEDLALCNWPANCVRFWIGWLTCQTYWTKACIFPIVNWPEITCNPPITATSKYVKSEIAFKTGIINPEMKLALKPTSWRFCVIASKSWLEASSLP